MRTIIKRVLAAIGGTDARTASARMNILIMFLLKALSIMVNLAMVPLLIDVLKPEVYGIWITLTAIVAWIGFFDIGLGHGLRNRLAAAVAEDNPRLARAYVSTAYVTMAFIVSMLLVAELALVPQIDWPFVLNAPGEMREQLTVLVMWVISLFLAQLLLKLITSIMLALQMPAGAAMVITMGQLGALCGILVALRFESSPGLLTLGLIVSVAPVLVLLITTAFLFINKYKVYSPSFQFFRLDLVHDVLSLGVKFFMIQVTGMLLFETSTIIIALTCGPAVVTEYHVAYKYVGVVYMVSSIITTPYWSAATEAYIKKDFVWIANSLRFLNKLWGLFAILGALLVVVADGVYGLWLGSSISPKCSILVPALVYYLLLMRWSIYGSILNGIGKIRLQFYVTLAEAVVHVPLAYWLGQRWCVKGVLASMVTMGLLNAIWPPIQLRRIVNGTARGIWDS